MTSSTKDDVVITMHPFEGLRYGSERLAKAKLAKQINAVLAERGLTQQDAAELLGMTQPETSQLSHGRLSGFSFDQLYRCLYALDINVEVTLRKHRQQSQEPAGILVHSILYP